MYRIKLIVNDNERWLTAMHYEYFCPVKIDKDYYTKFLYKNFPFELTDTIHLFPYNHRTLPTFKSTLKDEKLQREVYDKATNSDPVFFW